MADGANQKLLLDAVPPDSGKYEIPDPRPLENLETYVPACTSILRSMSESNDVGLQVPSPNIRLLAQLIASDLLLTSVAAGAFTVI